MSRSTRSRSKERSPDFKGIATPSPRNMSGRRISPRAIGDKTSPRAMGDNKYSPRGGVDTVSDTSSYRSHDASDGEDSMGQADESNLGKLFCISNKIQLIKIFLAAIALHTLWQMMPCLAL